VYIGPSQADDAEIARTIEKLGQQLSESDLTRRKEAAKALYELCFSVRARAAAAIPALLSCLGDADAEIAESAEWGLTYCSPLSIDSLTDCLSSADPNVRRRACGALGNIGDEAFAAGKAIRTLLTDTVLKVRERAAWALGLIHDTSKTTIDALFILAQESHPSGRAAALHALGNIGQSLGEPTQLRDRQSIILGALTDENDDIRWSACYVLEALRLKSDQHIALLMRVLETDTSSRVRSMAVKQLKELVPSANLTGYLPIVRKVIDQGGHEAVEMCECVAVLGSSASLVGPSLLRALEGEDHLAIKAARALWKVSGRADEVLPVLAKLFDENGESVCDVIYEIGPAAAPLVSKLIAALESDSWDLQWAAADALGAVASNNPDILSALSQALAHPSPIVKNAASRALARIGQPALPNLIEMLTDRADSRSEWAADALGRMGHQAASAAEHLRKMLRDSRPEVRIWSSIALAKVCSDPSMVPILIEFLERTDRPDIQCGAADGLAAIGPGAREALSSLHAALNDSDPNNHVAFEEAINAIERATN
jgi:HEAT repeat protein